MPPKEKLPDSVIADFAKWIEMGAPDPRKPNVTTVGGKINIARSPQVLVVPAAEDRRRRRP